MEAPFLRPATPVASELEAAAALAADAAAQAADRSATLAASDSKGALLKTSAEASSGVTGKPTAGPAGGVRKPGQALPATSSSSTSTSSSSTTSVSAATVASATASAAASRTAGGWGTGSRAAALASTAAAQRARAEEAAAERLPELLRALEDDFLAGVITHAQFLNIAEQLASPEEPVRRKGSVAPDLTGRIGAYGMDWSLRDWLDGNCQWALSPPSPPLPSPPHPLAVLSPVAIGPLLSFYSVPHSAHSLQKLTFYHRSEDVDERKAKDDAFAAHGARSAESLITHALRQLDGCLSRRQITKAQYDDLRASLHMGDAEEQEAVARAIEQMVPKHVQTADWNQLPLAIWIRVCSYLLFTEAALLALVSKGSSDTSHCSVLGRPVGMSMLLGTMLLA